MSITYRSQKGSQLTSQEVDDNFEYLAQQVGLSGLTTPGVYSLIGTELKLFAETWGWSVFGEAVTNIADYIYNVPSVTVGNRRVDVVCGNSTGGVLVLSGPAGPIEIEPIIPVNYAKLLKLSVSPEGVNVTSLLGNYVSKASEAWTNVIVTGASGADFLFYISENARKLNITGSPNNAVFAGFHASGGSVSQLWNGCDLYIKNSRPVAQLLRHNADGAAVKLFFQNEQDYLLPPKSIAHFLFNFTEMRYEFVQTTSFFVDDIKVSLPAGKSLGKYLNGDTISAAGKTFEDVLKDIAFAVQFPELTPFSISGSAGSNVEVGTPTKTIAVTFNRGQILGVNVDDIWQPTELQGYRLGDATKVWIDSIDNGLLMSRTISKTTVLGTNAVPIAVEYAAGLQPKDSANANFGSAEASGTLSTNVTWQGFYYRTAMAGNSVPTASQVRSATAKRNNAGLITLATGTTAKRFDVFVPQGSVLVSVIDELNFGVDLTENFILQEDDFSGLDAGSGEVLYKHYVMEIDNPYPISTNFKITTT